MAILKSLRDLLSCMSWCWQMGVKICHRMTVGSVLEGAHKRRNGAMNGLFKPVDFRPVDRGPELGFRGRVGSPVPCPSGRDYLGVACIHSMHKTVSVLVMVGLLGSCTYSLSAEPLQVEHVCQTSAWYSLSMSI